MTATRRRLGGWGFEGEIYPPSEQLLEWLAARIGRAEHPAPPEAASAPRPGGRRPRRSRSRRLGRPRRSPRPRPRSGPGRCPPPAGRSGVGAPRRRLSAVRLRAGRDSARTLLGSRHPGHPLGRRHLGHRRRQRARRRQPRADPRPRATRRTDRPRPERSGLATFGPGTRGPAVEAALAEHGLTLGHFPQSWELATVGGWVATRSSGQESLGYGRIEDMVAGLELVGPDGRLSLPARPASAAGPDLGRLVMGSRGPSRRHHRGHPAGAAAARRDGGGRRAPARTSDAASRRCASWWMSACR